MSVAVTFAQATIPGQDAQGGDTYAGMQSFAISIAPLCSDLAYTVLNGVHYDVTGTYLGGVYVVTFFILSTNNAAALALYTTYKNSLPIGTTTNLVHSNSTLGV
jgi:hypothetical protein